MGQRNDGRTPSEARPLKITTGYILHPEGSVLIETGNTKVICNASVEERVPPFLKGQGKGWVSAEYSMLPRSTNTRSSREAARGKQSGRTLEIQRLIGRSLRSVVDFEALGERTIWLDCDVIQADGGTRTASITGAYVAMVLAMQWMKDQNMIETIPVKDQVAAVSLGIVGGDVLLDLDYSEDSNAEVDMNVIMTSSNKLIEVQGTAEEEPFSRAELNSMLDLAETGLQVHFEAQRNALK